MNALSPYVGLIRAAVILLCIAAAGYCGYQLAAGKYQTQIATEQTLRTETTRKAQEAQLKAGLEAKAREAARIATLQQEADAREARIKDLEDEADRDRNAGRACLGADSLRRLKAATGDPARAARP